MYFYCKGKFLVQIWRFFLKRIQQSVSVANTGVYFTLNICFCKAQENFSTVNYIVTYVNEQ